MNTRREMLSRARLLWFWNGTGQHHQSKRWTTQNHFICPTWRFVRAEIEWSKAEKKWQNSTAFARAYVCQLFHDRGKISVCGARDFRFGFWWNGWICCLVADCVRDDCPLMILVRWTPWSRNLCKGVYDISVPIVIITSLGWCCFCIENVISTVKNRWNLYAIVNYLTCMNFINIFL